MTIDPGVEVPRPLLGICFLQVGNGDDFYGLVGHVEHPLLKTQSARAWALNAASFSGGKLSVTVIVAPLPLQVTAGAVRQGSHLKCRPGITPHYPAATGGRPASAMAISSSG